MMSKIIFRQTRRSAVPLVEAGFAEKRQFPVWREADVVEITFGSAGCVQCRTHEVREAVNEVATCNDSERVSAARIGFVWSSPTLLAGKKVVAGRTTWVGPNRDPGPVNAKC